ncbi:MAG: hypothetical protein J2P19_10585 [Pseudonocardia sp.]|nr:hypothetical protein [Pseudonocardia sp.]
MTGAVFAKGPQYNTTHVYVQPGTMGAFRASWMATFGGSSGAQAVVDVTPTPSETESQLVFSPVGTLSVFDFQTPIPYPFGAERTGLLLTDFDAGVQAARSAGANILVAPFPDPVGRDAVVQFPGGINTQLYWHKTAPNYAPLASVPENRFYLTLDSVTAFLSAYLKFTDGKVVRDNPNADAAEIGLPGRKFRRIAVQSPFGNSLVIVTDGHLPYPFGRELTGYSVTDLPATLAKATTNGAKTLWGPAQVGQRASALVQFPGGYIAEVHTGQEG